MKRNLVAIGTLEQIGAVITMARSLGLYVGGVTSVHPEWNMIKSVLIRDGNLCTLFVTSAEGCDEVSITDLMTEVCKHEPQIMAGEYKAEFKNDGVQFGCTFVPKDVVEKVYKKLFNK